MKTNTSNDAALSVLFLASEVMGFVSDDPCAVSLMARMHRDLGSTDVSEVRSAMDRMVWGCEKRVALGVLVNAVSYMRTGRWDTLGCIKEDVAGLLAGKHRGVVSEFVGCRPILRVSVYMVNRVRW